MNKTDPSLPITHAHRGLNRNLLILGSLALLTIGGIAIFVASRNGGNIFSTKKNITNQIIQNSYFTQLIASGATTEKDLNAVIDISPYGDGFIGISKEPLTWVQAQDLAKRTGSEILAVGESAAGVRQKLISWLATSFSSHLSSPAWVREQGYPRILDGPDVLAVTGMDRPRKALLQWGAQNRKGGNKQPISLFPPEVEAAIGKVTMNGVDPNRPRKPFTWNWGDGSTENGWFPNTHVYSDTQKQYQVTVTAHYEDGETGESKTIVSFKSSHSPEVEQALTLVTQLGGTYRTMKGAQGSPRVEIRFVGTKLDAALLRRLKDIPHLELLDLTGCPVGDDMMAVIGEMTELTDLSLWQGFGGITNDSLKYLERLSKLTRINLGGAGRAITGAGLVHLKGLTQLRMVALNTLSTIEDRHLTEVIALPNLEHLSIGCSSITGACLAELNRVPNLTILDLRNSQVTDDRLEHLQGIMHLKVLHLNNTRITDNAIASLRQLPSLTLIELTGTQITDAGVADLKAAIPGLKVTR